ncbi:hypothetical protein PLICRDRAFT_34744 [Plicaturopsis crispa FD-325 SS-3]|nr:hypothetical protein PLICRDRAFT_34744 [Plicaturopsis crispa FD-325 SS-3]
MASLILRQVRSTALKHRYPHSSPFSSSSSLLSPSKSSKSPKSSSKSPSPQPTSKSSTPPKPTPTRPHLPDAKMRALVALYHQSEHFISPHRLSAAIDAAFVRSHANSTLADPALAPAGEASARELEARVVRRRAQPVQVASGAAGGFGGWGGNGGGVFGGVGSGGWGGRVEGSEQAALYGVAQRGFPGWDIVKESAEEHDAERRRDREMRGLYEP